MGSCVSAEKAFTISKKRSSIQRKPSQTIRRIQTRYVDVTEIPSYYRRECDGEPEPKAISDVKSYPGRRKSVNDAARRPSKMRLTGVQYAVAEKEDRIGKDEFHKRRAGFTPRYDRDAPSYAIEGDCVGSYNRVEDGCYVGRMAESMYCGQGGSFYGNGRRHERFVARRGSGGDSVSIDGSTTLEDSIEDFIPGDIVLGRLENETYSFGEEYRGYCRRGGRSGNNEKNRILIVRDKEEIKDADDEKGDDEDECKEAEERRFGSFIEPPSKQHLGAVVPAVFNKYYHVVI